MYMVPDIIILFCSAASFKFIYFITRPSTWKILPYITIAGAGKASGGKL